MPRPKAFEIYPFWIPLLSIVQSLAIYAMGAYLVSFFGLIPVGLYLIFCLFVEYRVQAMSCRYCYYYGKLCGVGKGIITPFLFKKGDPKVFLEKAISWKDLIPDLLVFFIPSLAGIAGLFIRFNLLNLGLIVVLVILAMPGSGFMRSCLLCPNCKQKELGCPAEKLFGKSQQ